MCDCVVFDFSCFLSVMLVLLSGAPAGFFSVGIGGGRGQWLGGPEAPPEAESIFGRWMSNGAGKFSPCICISTLGATVMIWEKFYVEIQGGT